MLNLESNNDLVVAKRGTSDLMGRVLFALVLFFVLGLVHAQALAARCPEVSRDIPSANVSALALFRARVVEPERVGEGRQSLPDGFDTAEAHGARGDGVADDTRALQEALAEGLQVWLQSGRVYRITRRLDLGTGNALMSDGSATLLLSAGVDGFDNQIALRTDAALYGTRGVGLRVMGKNIAISDLFIVKEYADDRYVIGIDVRESSGVTIRRVRLRGFSLAPGIITIRSSDDVEVGHSLIHSSCTQSVDVPTDVATFQITGISVDDTRVAGRGSTGLRLHNNVIADLRMVPLTARGEQSDGINFAAIGTGSGSMITDNDIQNVDEGIDLFGSGIEIRGNRVAAHSLPLKLIHGARRIVAADNVFSPGPKGQAIGMFRANPAEPRRQVQDILIERNRVNMLAGQRAGVFVDAGGEYGPAAITLRNNRFVVDECRQQAIACSATQCTTAGNSKAPVQAGARCRD